MKKILKYIWLGLAIGSLIGVVGFGATHHLLTCGLCAIMYLASNDEADQK